MKRTLPSTALLLATIASAHAQVFLSSGTPSQTGNASIFYESPAVGQILAQEFTLAAPTDVSRIETFLGGSGSGVTVQLATQIGTGTGPEDVLASFSLANPGTPINQGVWVGADVSLSLDAGTYYLVYSGLSGGFLPTKAPTDIGPSYFAGQGNGDINFAFPPASDFLVLDATTAFGVRLTAVPEPATVSVISAAALAGFALWRHKR